MFGVSLRVFMVWCLVFVVCGLVFDVCCLVFVVWCLWFGLNQPFEPFKPVELFKHFFTKRS